jgi:hypothetical protein
MSFGQVARGAGGVKVGTEEKRGGPTSPAEPLLSIAELRQWLSDGRGASRVLSPREHRRLLRSIDVLRRRVEHFNREAPAGFQVELNPELVRPLAETAVCES